jgi:hypothetical protein
VAVVEGAPVGEVVAEVVAGVVEVDEQLGVGGPVGVDVGLGLAS